MPGRIRTSKAKAKVLASPTRKAKGKSLRELSQYVQFTPEIKDKFLNELREVPNVTRACRALSLTRRLVYNHRRDDPDFREAWDEAIEEGIESLEDIATERAIRISDTLMIFLLKGYKPEVYRERQDITTKGESLKQPITIVEVRLPQEKKDE